LVGFGGLGIRGLAFSVRGWRCSIRRSRTLGDLNGRSLLGGRWCGCRRCGAEICRAFSRRFRRSNATRLQHRAQFPPRERAECQQRKNNDYRCDSWSFRVVIFEQIAYVTCRGSRARWWRWTVNGLNPQTVWGGLLDTGRSRRPGRWYVGKARPTWCTKLIVVRILLAAMWTDHLRLA